MSFESKVTNRLTGNRYLISTAEIELFGRRIWQTTVYGQSIRLLAKLFRPKLFFSGVETSYARVQHERVEAMIHQIDPTDWEIAKRAYMMDVMNDQITDD
jgi:hypothetical protein